MKTLKIDYKNGNTTTYKLIEDGGNLPIAYHQETSQDVINTLEYVRKNRIRIRLYLGDTKTGKSWNEENYVLGYVSLSKGTKALFPILVFNNNSFGGGSILSHCIVKIKASAEGRVFYTHAKYKNPNIEIVETDLKLPYTHNVLIDGELYGRCKSYNSALRLKTKMS
jgi:hypothetical protein